MSIFLSCGEASGDYYVAKLAARLRQKGFSGKMWGLVGPQSEASGVEKTWSMGELQLMGIGEVLSSIPRLFSLKKQIENRIIQEAPRAVVVVDSPDFHLRLLEGLRSKGYGGKVVYLCPPTVWAWRSWRVKELRKLCDLCLPLFGFEHQFLSERGVKSLWVGHPFLDEFDLNSRFFPSFDPEKKDKVIGLLPGSRPSEVNKIFPVLLEVAHKLELEGFVPVFSIAPNLSEEMKDYVRSRSRPFEAYSGPGAELIERSDAVVGASGTVAVEALLRKRFMVVLYKASWSSWLAYKIFVKTPWISIPNILAGKMVFPELLQKNATASAVLEHLLPYLKDSAYRGKVHEFMDRACDKLGRPGALDLWAEEVLKGVER